MNRFLESAVGDSTLAGEFQAFPESAVGDSTLGRYKDYLATLYTTPVTRRCVSLPVGEHRRNASVTAASRDSSGRFKFVSFKAGSVGLELCHCGEPRPKGSAILNTSIRTSIWRSTLLAVRHAAYLIGSRRLRKDRRRQHNIRAFCTRATQLDASSWKASLAMSAHFYSLYSQTI